MYIRTTSGSIYEVEINDIDEFVREIDKAKSVTGTGFLSTSCSVYINVNHIESIGIIQE